MNIYLKTFIRLYSDVRDNRKIFLYETENFYVISDNYPVAMGHLLIVSKIHVSSFVALDSSLQKELSLIVNHLRSVFLCSDYILFEHGSSLSNNQIKASGNSVYHAHLHFIPSISIPKDRLLVFLSEYGLDLRDPDLTGLFYHKESIDILDILKNNLVFREGSFEPYLFIKYSKDSAFVIPERNVKNKVPSQFFRKIFANIATEKCRFWDWKNPISCKVMDTLKSRIKFVLDVFDNKI